MKFKILRSKLGDPVHEAKVRVFLDDGTELTGVASLEAERGPRLDPLRPPCADDAMPPPDRWVITRLKVEFANPDVEFIDELPTK